jgi:hypothetical protein
MDAQQSRMGMISVTVAGDRSPIEFKHQALNRYLGALNIHN